MIYDKTFVRSIFIFLLDDMVIDDALIWIDIAQYSVKLNLDPFNNLRDYRVPLNIR